MTATNDWAKVQEPAREALEHLRALKASLQRLRAAGQKIGRPDVTAEAGLLTQVLDRVGFNVSLASLSEDL